MHEPRVPDAASTGDAPDALIERGNALVRQGRVADALELYFSAVRAQPDRFEAHANLGSLLLAANRPGEAETHLRRALALRPGQVPLHVALGQACAARGRAAEAESCFMRALALAPGDATALLAWAGLLRQRGRFAQAAEAYRRLLARQPRHALAHYGLGHCLREQGMASEAADSFARAVAARPDYVDAHYRLAVLRPGEADAEHLAQLESLRPRVAAMAPPQRVRYWFTLGRRREDAGTYDEAFAAYAEGNRLQCQSLAPADRRAAQEALDARFVERIQSTFGGGFLRAAARASDTDARVPVFVVGMPRSGTSLVEQMLASHPAVHGGGEMRHLPAVLEAAFGFEESESADTYPEIVPALSADALARVGRSYLERAWRDVRDASHVTDKLTGNFLHLGMVALSLPRAKIIHVARDPRDTCFSCFANLFRHGDIAYSYDLEALGRHCVRRQSLMAHWCASMPADRLMTLRYEELVDDTEKVLRGLLDFLGLPWDERCLDFHRQRRAVHTVSVGQVGRPVYATSVARWRHFEAHLKPLLDILGEGD
jgi:tetratricopeptide (TPR) repeat protein